MTSGLHSCKPGNEPTVGETKNFTIEQRVGKSGKPWTKIKADREGQPYRVVKAVKTDFEDAYGNVSMNLEIEPQSVPVAGGVTPVRALNGGSGDDRSNRIERQHSQEMALRWFMLIASSNEGVAEIPATEKLRAMIDWFQRDVGRMPAPPTPKVAPEEFNSGITVSDGEITKLDDSESEESF